MQNMRISLDSIGTLEEGKGTCLLLPSGKEIAIFRFHGKYYAIDNLCPHAGGPLGEGPVENGIVTCPWHGWQFDIATGKNINLWDESVSSYPIVEEDGKFFLLIGEKEEKSR